MDDERGDGFTRTNEVPLVVVGRAGVLVWTTSGVCRHRADAFASTTAELVRHVCAVREPGDEDAPFVDAERFAKTAELLEIQAREARWWRDACLAYFSARSGLSLPRGVAQPEHSLEYYMSLRFPYAPGR